MTVLVSGASGGLGRFLCEQTDSVGLTRQQPLETLVPPAQPYDAIVHCAFNMGRCTNVDDLNAYVEDSVFLTRALTNVPHKLFVLISTIDVYPDSDAVHVEDEEINPNDLSGLYPVFKLACESIVRNKCQNALILRPGLLLGPYMRPNNLTRIVLGESGAITLSEQSSYYCVQYDDVLDVVRKAIAEGLSGTYNLVNSDQVTLKQLAERFAPDTQFGNYSYIPNRVSNQKISNVSSVFQGTSLEAVEHFSRKMMNLGGPRNQAPKNK